MAQQVRSLFGGTGSTLGQQRLKVPESVGQIQNNSFTAPAIAPRVSGSLFSSAAGPVLSGLQAGQSAPAGTDLTSSLIGGGVSTLAGAGSGALTGAAIGAAGGPIGAGVGALIGGGTALLSSALNSFLSVRSENKRKREMAKFIKEVEAKQAKREAQNRKDSLMQLQFQRGDIERDKAIQTFSAKRQMLLDTINNNDVLKNRFIQTGIR